MKGDDFDSKQSIGGGVDRAAENLVIFIRQNNGTLSSKRREGEIRKLRDQEVTLIEGIVDDAFARF